MRGFIKINGDPVVELDYDALHVFMLYHLRGIDIDIEQDPYEMIVGSEARAIKKKALLTAINAVSDELAIKGGGGVFERPSLMMALKEKS